jgi:uncharacterized metal-binding protein
MTEGSFDIKEIYTIYQLNLEQYYRLVLMALFAYVLGTELFSPDLDIDSIPYRRLSFIYFPLKWYLKPHRGKAHEYLKGPVIQILYLGLLVAILFFVLTKTGHELNFVISDLNIQELIGLLSGIALSNWIHILMDDIYKKLGWSCS